MYLTYASQRWNKRHDLSKTTDNDFINIDRSVTKLFSYKGTENHASMHTGTSFLPLRMRVKKKFFLYFSQPFFMKIDSDIGHCLSISPKKKVLCSSSIFNKYKSNWSVLMVSYIDPNNSDIVQRTSNVLW